MAASASLAPRYRSILVSSYHLILRSSAVLEVLPRRVGCTKTLPIAARRRAMKRQILLLALAQAALTTSVKRTIWPDTINARMIFFFISIFFQFSIMLPFKSSPK